MAEEENQLNTANPSEQWLSIGDAATLLGVSRDTLRRWEKVSKIKVYRSPTNRRIYKQSQIEAVYKQHQQGDGAFSKNADQPSPNKLAAATLDDINPTPVKKEEPETVAPIATTAQLDSNLDTQVDTSEESQAPTLDTPATTETNHLSDSLETFASNIKEAKEPTTEVSLPTPLSPQSPSPSLSVVSPPEYFPQLHQTTDFSIASSTPKDDFLSDSVKPTPPKQVEVLKLIAIGLTFVLIVLGIVITVLVFI